MKGVDDHFYRRLLNFLYENGLTPIEHATPEEPLEIYRDRDYVCSFGPKGQIRGKEPNHDLDLIIKFKQDKFRNYTIFDYLPDMPFSDVSEYKKYYEAGMAVLAVTMLPNDELQFATWEYSYDRKGVGFSHYFGEDFKAAKEDFAIRAGLVDDRKLFSPDEYALIHTACCFSVMGNDNLTKQEEESFYRIISQIELAVPSVRPTIVTEADRSLSLEQEECL